MLKPFNKELPVIILGGGLTGLAAAYQSAKAGIRTELYEQGPEVGGLSRTVRKNGYGFDLGGHRFFSTKPEINALINDLMRDELASVSRSSTIFLRGKYFNYPLTPLNAISGMGIPTTVKIIEDYITGKIRNISRVSPQLSLEDWVVCNFGRTMFNIYFKEYSEKVWGIDCRSISVDWVARRIKGLSLGGAIKNAFFKFSGRDIPSLVDNFIYPKHGIGRIADRLLEEIERDNSVFADSAITKVGHSRSSIEYVETTRGSVIHRAGGSEFVSSIPITKLVRLLEPAAPSNVLNAASSMRFRDLVVVALMIDRERATDQTWIYIPEKKIPFGRIHEPTNWSREMAPEGKTILVAEYFSFEGDHIWSASDDQLTEMTMLGLKNLGFIKKSEVSGSAVVRARQAYPLFELGYAEQCAVLYNYLGSFSNLHLAGRVGRFKYYNMDYAIESGLRAADRAIQNAAGDRQWAIGMVA